MTDTRPLRGCEECGQVDDHPRVIHPLGPDDEHPLRPEVLDLLLSNGISGEMLVQLQDPNSVIRHHDCCASAGCPTGICNEVVTKNDGKIGPALVKSIQAGDK